MQGPCEVDSSNIHEPLAQQIIDTSVNREIKAISKIQSFHFSSDFALADLRSDIFIYANPGFQLSTNKPCKFIKYETVGLRLPSRADSFWYASFYHSYK